MKAAGRWAWINNYAVPNNTDLVARAKDTDGVIVKWGMQNVRTILTGAGIPYAVEAYVKPDEPAWGPRLADWATGGAAFVVINAEVEWEPTDGTVMESLLKSINRAAPNTELYASVDTRGNRLQLPYQKVLARYITGWMPMIYPLSFQQSPAQAFVSCLHGKNFSGLPVLPTIQLYDHIGALAVTNQLHEVESRDLPGCQAYTLGHATAEEWAVFTKKEDEVTKEEVLAMLTYTAAVLRNEMKTGFDQIENLLKDGLTDLDTRVKELEKRP